MLCVWPLSNYSYWLNKHKKGASRKTSQTTGCLKFWQVCARSVSQLQLHYCNSSRVQTFLQSYAVLHTEFTVTVCSRYMSFIGMQRIWFSVLFHCAINRFQKTKYKGTLRVLWICAAIITWTVKCCFQIDNCLLFVRENITMCSFSFLFYLPSSFSFNVFCLPFVNIAENHSMTDAKGKLAHSLTKAVMSLACQHLYL